MSLHWRSENNTVSDVNGTKIFSYGKNVTAIALLRCLHGALLLYLSVPTIKCPELLEMSPNFPSFVIPQECHWGTQDFGCRQCWGCAFEVSSLTDVAFSVLVRAVLALECIFLI